MTSRHAITIALSAAGLVCAALIAALVLGDLGAPSTQPGPEPIAPPTSLGGAHAPGPAPAPVERSTAPEPAAVEQMPAPPKLVPPGAEPQPPRPAQPANR